MRIPIMFSQWMKRRAWYNLAIAVRKAASNIEVTRADASARYKGNVSVRTTTEGSDHRRRLRSREFYRARRCRAMVTSSDSLNGSSVTPGETQAPLGQSRNLDYWEPGPPTETLDFLYKSSESLSTQEVVMPLEPLTLQEEKGREKNVDVQEQERDLLNENSTPCEYDTKKKIEYKKEWKPPIFVRSGEKKVEEIRGEENSVVQKSLVGRIMTMTTLHRDRWDEVPEVEIDEGSVKNLTWLLLKAAHVPMSNKTDPSEDALMETLSREKEILEKKIERQILRYRKLTDEAQKEKTLKLIESLESKLFEFCQRLWSLFRVSIGFCPTVSSYSKKKMDIAMENCFGSLDKKGNHIFDYDGISLCVEDPFGDLDPRECNRVFSLYLGRKCLCPKGMKDLDDALEDFYNRVCKEAPEHKERDGILKYFESICETLFTRKSYERFFADYNEVPLHSSACVELSKQKGGKREFEYCTEEKKYEKDRVQPVAIFTGGKIRVITKDSAYNMRYAKYNAYMAAQIRRCKWSVFGKDVALWLDGNPEFLTGSDDYLSGDLESATDLFDGSFARACIDRLVQISGGELDSEDAAQMKGFTTDAMFWPDMLEQQRGQMMGSILSFPILCLVSFVVATYRTNFFWQFVREKKNKKKILINYSQVGVNGDDVVLRCTDNGRLWCDNVEAVGGRVSRGKSLLNKDMFTINSEIWVRDRYGWRPPASIRPTILFGISDGRKANPTKLWEEYSRSSYLEPMFRKWIEKNLQVGIPVSWGGLGKKKTENEVDIIRAWLTKVNWRRGETCRPGWSKEREEAWVERKRHMSEYLVAREDADELVKEDLKEFKGLPMWTKKEDRFKVSLEDTMHQIRFMSEKEKKNIVAEYEAAVDLDRRGLKKVRLSRRPEAAELPAREKRVMGHSWTYKNKKKINVHNRIVDLWNLTPRIIEEAQPVYMELDPLSSTYWLPTYNGAEKKEDRGFGFSHRLPRPRSGVVSNALTA